MNTHRINYQEPIYQSHGSISDFNFDFDCSSQFLGTQQPNGHQMGTNCFQQPCTGSAMEDTNLRSQNLRPATIMGGFKSPASAFYATELFMGFDPQLPSTNNTPIPSQVSNTCNSQTFPAYHSDPSFDARNTLQSIVRSHFCSNQFSKMIPSTTYGGLHQNKPLGEDQDQRVHGTSASGSVPTGSMVSSKIRIRWTQELHEKFVECVNRLHGAEKATPKAILKLMDTEGLTIFHVKSHLQKYRIAKFMPEKTEGKSDKRDTMNDLSQQLDSKTGLQLKEALQLQLDVQRKLHEQLEVQRNLQLRIEEQGKQLRMMFDRQQKANNPLKSDRSLEESGPRANLSSSLADVEACDAKEDGSNNTIFPSKRYRIAKLMAEKAEEKSDKRATMNDLHQLDSKTGLQIKEELQLQLDVQRRLHEQFENRINLPLRIEEQGKMLKITFDQQQVSPYAEDQDQDQTSGFGLVPTRAVVPSKIRIKWTQELHEKFVDCVNSLHGPEKATPRAVLKLMNTEGLKLFQVKRHLQECRRSKFTAEKAEGKSDKRATKNDLPPLDSKI